MVIDREKSARYVAWAAATHAGPVAGKLAPLLQAELRAGEQVPDVALLVRLLGRSLQGTMRVLGAAAAAHEAELGDDTDPRRRRDTAAAVVYGCLTAIRSGAVAAFGPEAIGCLALEGATPTDPTTVKAVGASVLKNLPRLRDCRPLNEGVSFDAAKLGEQLTAALPPLERALEDVAREAREAEQTLVAKQRRLAEHDERFRTVAAVLETVFALAGERGLADRVRPSGSRPGQTATEPPPVPIPDGPID